MVSDTSVGLLDAMKRAAAILRDHHVDFALAGGQAVYARGGPESGHDVDFILRLDDAEEAVALLEQAGFRAERPPEGWLYKVYDGGGALIDLIFAPNNRPEEVPAILAHADKMEIHAITLKVMSVTDVSRRSSALSRSTRSTTTTRSRSRVRAASRSTGSRCAS